MTELATAIETMNKLIVDDEWYNIPHPIRKTCEGIILFAEKLTGKVIANADSTHRKVLLLDEKQKAESKSFKGRCDNLEQNIHREK